MFTPNMIVRNPAHDFSAHEVIADMEAYNAGEQWVMCRFADGLLMRMGRSDLAPLGQKGGEELKPKTTIDIHFGKPKHPKHHGRPRKSKGAAA